MVQAETPWTGCHIHFKLFPPLYLLIFCSLDYRIYFPYLQLDKLGNFFYPHIISFSFSIYITADYGDLVNSCIPQVSLKLGVSSAKRDLNGSGMNHF